MDAGKVLCRVCNKEVNAKGLSGHIGKTHKLNKAGYIAAFPGSDMDFADYVPPKPGETPPVEDAPGESTEEPEQLSTMTTQEQILTSLTPKERETFQKFYDEVFQQIDRDTVQIPVVESLALDVVMLQRARLQKAQQKKGFNKALDDEIAAVSARIDKQMGALGISRAEKLKNKVQIKSSPSALISGYLDEIERMSVEQLQTMKIEEQRALAVAEARIKTWILDVAPDIKKDSNEDDDVVPDIDEIVRRAGISI